MIAAAGVEREVDVGMSAAWLELPTGAGYGAYKTNNDCGTILGKRGFGDAGNGATERGPVTQTALRPATSEDIRFYSAR